VVPIQQPKLALQHPLWGDRVRPTPGAEGTALSLSLCRPKKTDKDRGIAESNPGLELQKRRTPNKFLALATRRRRSWGLSGLSRTKRSESVFSDNSAANHHREQATKGVEQDWWEDLQR
jgi:hypothetical protein